MDQTSPFSMCKCTRSLSEHKLKIKDAAPFWRFLVIVLVPILLLPIILQNDTKESRCGYTLCLVGLLWATEALPLPITSLLPVVFLPLFGILTTQEVSQQYFNNANMMFLGAMGVAAAVERVGLHRRLALLVLMCLGSGRRSLLFAFMLTTAFLSCFICNTATTAMMVPVLAQVLEELHQEDELSSLERKRRYQREKVMFYLGIAYSANLGGTGTLTASAPNIVLKGFMTEHYPNQNDLNYATWMLYAAPALIASLLLTWAWLIVLFKGYGKRNTDRDCCTDCDRIKEILVSKYAELGSVAFKEIAVALCFLFLITAWFFQEPGFISGWGDYFQVVRNGQEHGAVDEATSATLVLVFLFIIPSHFNFYPFVDKSCSTELPDPILDWKTLTTFFPWGLLLLRGGGFALAEASTVSGLSAWIGIQLTSLSSMAPWALLLITSMFTSLTTELISNAATANILLPILAELSSATGTNPIYFLLPATLSCCNAFMLPVAAPPNAIVYQAAEMKTSQMMKAGVVVNLLTLLVSMVAINTYGVYIFNLNTFPDWANSANITLVNSTERSLGTHLAQHKI